MHLDVRFTPLAARAVSGSNLARLAQALISLLSDRPSPLDAAHGADRGAAVPQTWHGDKGLTTTRFIVS
ncbi:hypothetical protein GCM10020229_48320 [Kitasatospora albolonga]